MRNVVDEKLGSRFEIEGCLMICRKGGDEKYWLTKYNKTERIVIPRHRFQNTQRAALHQ